MNQLTYESLITYHPFYNCHLLAGWIGKLNIFQHVSFNESPTKNNSLLLIKYSDEQTNQITSHLQNFYTTGMILVADEEKYISTSVLDLANSLKKPLLFIKTNDEAALYERLQQIIQLQNVGLQEFVSNDLTTYWLHLFYQTDIVRVMHRLSTFIGEEVYFFTKKKKFLPISPTDAPIEHLSELKHISGYSHRLTTQLSEGFYKEQKYLLYEIIDFSGENIGYFLFKMKGFLTDATVHQLNTISTTIITWDAQTEISISTHQKYKDQFLFDLLNNNIETETELFELGKMWRIVFSPNGFVLAVDLNSSQPITKDVYTTVQELLLETNHLTVTVHSTYLNHRVVVIVIPSNDQEIEKEQIIGWLEAAREKIGKKLPMLQTKIGIGRSYPSALHTYKSFQEAKIALQMYEYVFPTKGIIHYEDIGYIRLLSYIHDDLLDDFAQQHLEKLAQYDLQNETDYVQTLYVYCNNDGDIVKSADSLFIHQNTLRQRLKKIESILNIQLNRYADLVNLIIALKITKDMKI